MYAAKMYDYDHSFMGNSMNIVYIPFKHIILASIHLQMFFLSMVSFDITYS